jgi:hypothetical protein
MEIPNTPLEPPKLGWLSRFLLHIAGADEELLKKCPPRDLNNVRAVAGLMLATLCYQTGLFALIGHELFAPPGQIRPEIILGALAIATFVLLIDSFAIMRCGWHLEGLKELRRGGLDIGGGAGSRVKAGLFLSIRVLILSVGLAQLTALFVSLVVFSTDIHARIDKTYRTENGVLIAKATELVDAPIQRQTEEVKAETARVAGLSAQVESLRQNVIDPAAGDRQIQEAEKEVQRLIGEKAKADEELTASETFAANEYGGIKAAPGNTGRPGFGLRYRAAMEQVAKAKGRLQKIEKDLEAARARLETLRKQNSAATETVLQRSRDQLPGFEDNLKAEATGLETHKKELADLIANRETAIRAAVERDPQHVRYDDGFLNQLKTLDQIAHEDTKIALVIILIDVVSFGLELAAVLSKAFGYAPTTFSALLESDIYRQVVHIAQEMTAELEAIETGEQPSPPEPPPPEKPAASSEEASAAPPAGPSAAADGAPALPAKRPRGRPRKHPRPDEALRTANGQASSEAGSDQQKRA